MGLLRRFLTVFVPLFMLVGLGLESTTVRLPQELDYCLDLLNERPLQWEYRGFSGDLVGPVTRTECLQIYRKVEDILKSICDFEQGYYAEYGECLYEDPGSSQTPLLWGVISAALLAFSALAIFTFVRLRRRRQQKT